MPSAPLPVPPMPSAGATAGAVYPYRVPARQQYYIPAAPAQQQSQQRMPPHGIMTPYRPGESFPAQTCHCPDCAGTVPGAHFKG